MGDQPAQLRGIVGQIRWGYYVAAAINGYALRSLGPGGQGFILEGTIVNRDAFKLSQRPLVFVAPFKHGETQSEWIWPVVDFTIADSGRLTARLGPPVG